MKPTIALFRKDPVAAISCCNGIINALEPYYKIKIVGKKILDEKDLSKYKILAFPGGSGDADLFDRVVGNKSEAVKNYIDNGGHYLGICMGAYWAGKNYFNLIDRVKVHRYIERPSSEVKRSYQTTLEVDWKGETTQMYFFDGCSFTGKGFKTIARYANGEPMAIIKRRVGLIGCHPESDKHWYSKPYLKPYWHKKTHHKLLREFVDQLLTK